MYDYTWQFKKRFKFLAKEISKRAVLQGPEIAIFLSFRRPGISEKALEDFNEYEVESFKNLYCCLWNGKIFQGGEAPKDDGRLVVVKELN